MMRRPADLTIDVEDTPNPRAMKFTLNRVIAGGQPRSYASADAAADDPLARELFAIGHVCNVMIVNDFCTINRTATGRWKAMIPKVTAVLTEHFAHPGA